MGFLLASKAIILLLTVPLFVKGCTDILVTPGASLDGKLHE
jgi:hypothetical protein